MTIFDTRKAEIVRLVAQARSRPERQLEIKRDCEHILLPHKDLYLEAGDVANVPAIVLMALSMREMSGRIDCYLGNGQPLSRRTTIVPKGRGPFVGDHAFRDGCEDACRLDGLSAIFSHFGKTTAVACFATEEFNGDGYRRYGIPTPYVYGATTVQRPGKFIRDHVYSTTEMDTQVGTLAIIETLAALDPSLALEDMVPIKIDPVHVPIVPVDGPSVGAAQRMLNTLRVDGTPLLVDNSFGRQTRRAMWAYQAKKKLPRTWSLDPRTFAALRSDTEEL